MTYTRRHARPLLTAGEFELFSTSLADRIGELDKAQLRRTIDRCRKARDKYRDLYQRQAVAKRERAGARGAAQGANERTAKKATIFAEALGRLEQRLERVQAGEDRAARHAALERAAAGKGTGAPPSGNRAARRAAAGGRRPRAGKFMSESAAGEHRSVVYGPTAKSISAHRSAAGRRSQAKRDSR